jgi:type IV pilus assembly protein PilY1
VDFVSFDSNNDGYTDKIYAGDMGGQIFALKGPSDGSVWAGRKLFQAGNGTSDTSQMKFFYAPDVALQGYQTQSKYNVYDHVYIGTGDREHPNDTIMDNRFYGIKNKDDDTVLSEGNLTDVTFYQNGYQPPHNPTYLRSEDSRGWFIRLGYELGTHVRSGEKVVSPPIVFNGIVFFTTFVPGTSDTGEDKCIKPGTGEGFLYAVDYLTGEAVAGMGFNVITDPDTGKPILNETNRRISLGAGMPSFPRLTVTPKGPVLIIGTQTRPIPYTSSVKEYFWLQ